MIESGVPVAGFQCAIQSPPTRSDSAGNDLTLRTAEAGESCLASCAMATDARIRPRNGAIRISDGDLGDVGRTPARACARRQERRWSYGQGRTTLRQVAEESCLPGRVSSQPLGPLRWAARQGSPASTA